MPGFPARLFELTNGDGGMLLRSTSCGIDVHVSTQCPSSCRFSTASGRAGTALLQVVRARRQRTSW